MVSQKCHVPLHQHPSPFLSILQQKQKLRELAAVWAVWFCSLLLRGSAAGQVSQPRSTQISLLTLTRGQRVARANLAECWQLHGWRRTVLQAAVLFPVLLLRSKYPSSQLSQFGVILSSVTAFQTRG